MAIVPADHLLFGTYLPNVIRLHNGHAQAHSVYGLSFRARIQPRDFHWSRYVAAVVPGLGLLLAARHHKHVKRRTYTTLRDSNVATTHSKKAPAANAWGDKFRWQKAWYPLAVVADMDIGRPTKLELLGEDLVAWRDLEGHWRVFEDRCPHRSVPLSEGRIEKDGTLLCSYHGWRFNEQGQVIALPQAKAIDFPQIRKSHRACAATRPAQVRHGILWVWGESSENAALESALVEANVVRELEDPEMADRASAFVWAHRDLPYGWEVAMENVIDASHVAVAHHNRVSNRYTDPAPMEITWERKATCKGGFKFRMKNLRPKKGMENHVSTTDFRPPNQVHNRVTAPNGSSLTLLLHFSPTKPGRCRLLVSFLSVTGENGEAAPKPMPNASSVGVELRQQAFALLPLLPRWLVHILAPVFLHQDLVFLHHQQATLQRHEAGHGRRWKDLYFTPSQTDTGSLMLRRWLDKNGGIDWVPGLESERFAVQSKEQLFDTYHSHTAHCTSCQQALGNFTIGEKLLRYLSVTAGAAGLISANWTFIAGAIACGMAAEGCAGIIGISQIKILLKLLSS